MSRKRTIIVMLLFWLTAVGLKADLGCTFLGEGQDVIHEIAVSCKDGITITLPPGEKIAGVMCKKSDFSLVRKVDGIQVVPGKEAVAGYIAILSDAGCIYILRLTGAKEGDHVEDRVLIRALNERE